MHPYELPRGWLWTTLGEIGEINPKLIDHQHFTEDAEVTFLPMKCVEELTGKLDLSLTKRLSEVRRGYTPFTDGDLLFAKITPCMENGKVAVTYGLRNGIGFGSTEFHVIRLPQSFPRKFFFYYLVREDLRKDAQRNMTGSAGQLRVPLSYMQQIPIALPPLPEQHRIVAKIEELFTKLDAGVEALKRVKTQLKRYRQSVLKHAFEGKLTAEWREAHKHELEPASVLLERIKHERKKTAKGKYKELPPLDASNLPQLPEGWMWTRLSDYSSLITKGESPNWQGFEYVDSGITFIRSENVLWGKVDISEAAQIPQEFHNKLKRSQVRPNDVLINLVGASIGRSGLAPEMIESANINQAVALVRCNQSLLPAYLMHVFLSPQVQEAIRASKVETARPNISLEDLRDLAVPLASVPEQYKIVEEIERRFSVADQIEKTVDHSLKQAERLRQSILKRAFEGKLVPQDPRDETAEKLLERIKAERAKYLANAKAASKAKRKIHKNT
jgi:type I restriction enzyme S subunit